MNEGERMTRQISKEWINEIVTEQKARPEYKVGGVPHGIIHSKIFETYPDNLSYDEEDGIIKIIDDTIRFAEGIGLIHSGYNLYYHPGAQ